MIIQGTTLALETNGVSKASVVPTNSPQTITLPPVPRLGGVLRVDEMARPPVALHEAPRARHVHGVPRVPEAVVFEPHAGLVARRLAVAFDHDAVEAGVTASCKKIRLDLTSFTKKERKDNSIYLGCLALSFAKTYAKSYLGMKQVN